MSVIFLALFEFFVENGRVCLGVLLPDDYIMLFHNANPFAEVSYVQ